MINNKSKSITVEKALNKSKTQWIDVRSPREYNKGHFTDAINIPIFSDKQFSELGTLYKHHSQEKAMQLGQEYANEKTAYLLNKLSKIKHKKIILYCARGGMRSKGMQTLLYSENFTVYRIERGYKAIREYVLNSFTNKKKLIIVGGNTGSGKTTILNEMKSQGLSIIDLERIANHRGSVFGDLGLSKQSTQQQFENDLAYEWLSISSEENTYIESESRKIGRVVIPNAIWEMMEEAMYIKIDMSIKRRVNNLLDEYGTPEKSILKEKIDSIANRLGSQNSKIIKEELDKNNLPKFCKMLLENYYDKLYQKSYDRRETSKKIIQINGESNNKIISKIVEISNG